jgi:hypothetical protein
MKGNIEERLERLNRKYSQYGEVYDYVSSGSIEETDNSWNTAKIIALERDEYKCRICGKAPMIQRTRKE